MKKVVVHKETFVSFDGKEFSTADECADYEKKLKSEINKIKKCVNAYNMTSDDGVFYIENTIDYDRSLIRGYFKTIEDAIVALRDCQDWYSDKGTGTIYYRTFGLHGETKNVYRK